MKVIKEIGFAQAFKFLLYVVIAGLYKLAFIPPLRSLYLNVLGASIQSESILMNVKFINWHHMGPKGLKIGKNCFIGDEALLDLHDSIVLEDNVTIAARAIILTHINVGYNDHPLQRFFPQKSSPVTLKKGSVIGAGAIILSGLTIGANSFVGAGSVVLTNVLQNSLFAGNPAKFIRKIK